MIKLTEEQIKEIADNLDSGFRSYYNKNTGELKSVINTENWLGADLEPCENEIEEIDENWDDYIEFDNLETHESFEIMEDFAESIDDAWLQEKLIHALNKSKPFRNFKWVIDNSGEYRQRWFDFKKARYIQVVKDKIELINNYEEDV